MYVRKACHLEPFGDASDAGNIGLEESGSTLRDVVSKSESCQQVLPHGKRDGELAGEGGVPRDIVGIQRLFKPVYIASLQAPSPASRRVEVPAFVGINHDGQIIAKVSSNGANRARSSAGLGRPNLDLNHRPTRFERSLDVGNQLRQSEMQPSDVGVVGGGNGLSLGAPSNSHKGTPAANFPSSQQQELGHYRKADPLSHRVAACRSAVCALPRLPRARATANNPSSITPPPEVKLLRISLGPEHGTT